MSFLGFTSTRLGSEVSCPRTLPRKNQEDPVRLEPRTTGLRVKHFNFEPCGTPFELKISVGVENIEEIDNILSFSFNVFKSLPFRWQNVLLVNFYQIPARNLDPLKKTWIFVAVACSAILHIIKSFKLSFCKILFLISTKSPINVLCVIFYQIPLRNFDLFVGGAYLPYMAYNIFQNLPV